MVEILHCLLFHRNLPVVGAVVGFNIRQPTRNAFSRIRLL